jgi:3-dehydroquinate dehydratase-2
MRKLLLVNGPNLNLLGRRSPAIYGVETLAGIVERLSAAATSAGFELEAFQSNHEGAIIDYLHQQAPSSFGIIINPGALGHYSYALRDAIEAVAIPAVEVHISDIHTREEFRRLSVIEPVCVKQVVGLGVEGYFVALRWFEEHKS